VIERAAAERERAREHHPADRLGIQFRSDCGRHVEGIGQIGRDGRIPERAMRRIERVRRKDSGKMDQGIDRTLDAGERRRAGIRRFEGRDDGAHARAGREVRGERRQGRGAGIDQQQLGALRQQQPRGLARDAARAAGDHDQPVLERHVRCPPLGLATLGVAAAAVNAAP
jgi:hypothetical protein